MTGSSAQIESVSPSISKHQEHCILRQQWEIGGREMNKHFSLIEKRK